MFFDEKSLLERTEKEGMTPLLKKPLKGSGGTHPASVRRSQNILVRRLKEEAQIPEGIANGSKDALAGVA